MLGDQQRDKDLARNQVMAIVLTTVLFLGWMYFFGPKPPQPAQQPVEVAQEAAGTVDPAPSPAMGDTPDAIPAPADAPVADSPPPDGLLDALKYDPETAPAQEYSLSVGNLDLVFTDIGARLKQSTVQTVHGHNQPLVPVWGQETREDEAVYPLSLVFEEDTLPNVNQLRWTAETAEDGQSLTFHIDLPAPYAVRLTKTYRVAADQPNVLDLEVTYANLGPDTRRLGLDDKEPAFVLSWAPNVNSGDAGNLMAHQEIVWRENGENIHTATSKLPGFDASEDVFKRAIDPEWVGIKSAYFIVAMKPEYEGARGMVDGEPKHFTLLLSAPRMEIPAGASETRAFKVYLGPLQSQSLAMAWPSLKTSLEFFTMFGFMDSFAKGMLFMLNWFYGIIPNYGVAIILLTLLVRTAMFPLTLKGMKSMKKMQKLAPEMEKIKEEVGDDQQEMQKRIMEMYRERGVNPLGGCMPLLLQTPVFIALYRVYATAYEFRGAPFAGWIDDLSVPDALYTFSFAIPVPFTNGIDSFNLLPILMALSMIASTKLMPTSGPVQNPQQKMIMTMMPIVFGVICYNMAAGLNLYILTSTLLGIAQNYFVHVSDEEVKSKPGKAKVQKLKQRRKHFYLAAQDKKREMAREERREKKKRRGRGGKQTGGSGSEQP